MQTLLVPFYQVLAVTDEPLLFKKVVHGILNRILKDVQPGEDGAAARLPNVNLKEMAKDIFSIASNECVPRVYVCVRASYDFRLRPACAFGCGWGVRAWVCC